MKAKIEILKGAPPRTLRIESENTITIGRGKEAELQILSSLVSRRHCQLVHDGKVWILKDLNSRNGTWLDGERVRSRAITDGDIFTLGKRISIRLTIPPQPRADAAAGGEFDAEICAFCVEPIEPGEPATRGAEEAAYHKGCHDVFQLLGVDLGGIRLIERIGGSRPMHRIRAHQPSLNRNVQLCAFDPETVATGDFRARLLDEVRALSRLLHPKILQIHDLVEERGAALVVTEYFQGETLKEVLRKKKFVKVPAALSIATQVVDGLAYAEGQERVVDRISPAEILVGETELAKLDLIRPPIPATVSVSALCYLAPELISSGAYRQGGRPAAPDQRDSASRSAVYSFGAIFYHMLAGIPPFEGETVEAIMPRILKKTPPQLSRVNLKVSPALARLIERCMNKSPAGRPAGFQALQADLKKITSPGR